MSGFKLDDSYVEVAERIRIFRDKFPEGSLQSEIRFGDNDAYVLCIAWAYRSADDARPGIGHSRLAIPGTTPYTRGSEVENAETSAWGRAIIAALAADAKRIASADEVRSKHDSAGTDHPVGGAVEQSALEKGAPSTQTAPAPSSSFKVPERAREGALGLEDNAANLTQEQRNMEAASRVRKMFGAEKYKSKTILEIDQMEKGRSHLEWVASDAFDPKQDTQKHFKQAVIVYLAGGVAADPDADIPF